MEFVICLSCYQKTKLQQDSSQNVNIQVKSKSLALHIVNLFDVNQQVKLENIFSFWEESNENFPLGVHLILIFH